MHNIFVFDLKIKELGALIKALLLFHAEVTYPPKIYPVFDFIIIKVGYFPSHLSWKVEEKSPSLLVSNNNSNFNGLFGSHDIIKEISSSLRILDKKFKLYLFFFFF